MLWWHWCWRRRYAARHAPVVLEPGQRWPDGDTVVPDGYQRWVDLLDRDPLGEATRVLPVYRPLMTPAARWRSRRWGR